jgi:hypothetical protein
MRSRREKVSSRDAVILLNKFKNQNMPFAASEHLSEELCISALLTLKVEYFLECRGGARIPAVFVKEKQTNMFLNNNNN